MPVAGLPRRHRRVQGNSLLILDPANGQSLVEFGVFPLTYFGGASLDGYAFAKK
jgi:hypothetical protein